jgi:hypothetical protein
MTKSINNNNPGLTNTVCGYGLAKSVIQTRNSGETVIVNDVLDDTEGLTALDTLPFTVGSRNLDIGGGRFDEATRYLRRQYGVDNLVYDPYCRSKEHNTAILKEVKKNPVDSVTSNSVLNVILAKKERKSHIKLAHSSLKNGGIAFFKIWRGDGSGVPNGFQSNKEAKYYVNEIKQVFGSHIELVKDDIGNTIFAKKIVKNDRVFLGLKINFNKRG